MKKLGKTIAHIPARAGSKRIKLKNMRELCGKPLILYAINAALHSEILDEIYVNTDSDEIAEFAIKSGVKVYRRSSHLASDTATSDEFNMDIINSLNPDTLVMINPVCPIIDSSDIDDIVNAYNNMNVDTLITSSEEAMQCFYNDDPVNVILNEQLAPTQNNKPVHICNWAVTIWDAKKFKERYDRNGYAVFGDKRKLFPIGKFKSIKISVEEDFQFAEMVLKKT